MISRSMSQSRASLKTPVLLMIHWPYVNVKINLKNRRIEANLFSLIRTSLYYRPVALFVEELEIKNRIDQIYAK